VPSKLIELDKFIEFFQVDPHYFERTFLLIPNNSEKPYALLKKVLEKTGLEAIGKVTMSTMERVEALITSTMKGEVAEVEEEKPKKACGKEHDGGAESDGGILEVTH